MYRSHLLPLPVYSQLMWNQKCLIHFQFSWKIIFASTYVKFPAPSQYIKGVLSEVELVCALFIEADLFTVESCDFHYRNVVLPYLRSEETP